MNVVLNHHLGWYNFCNELLDVTANSKNATRQFADPRLPLQYWIKLLVLIHLNLMNIKRPVTDGAIIQTFWSRCGP